MKSKIHRKFLIFILLTSILLSGCGGVWLFLDRFSDLTPFPKTENESPLESTPAPTMAMEIRGDLESIQTGFSSVYEQMVPSVVNIQAVQVLKGGPGMEDGDFSFPFLFPPGRDGEFRRSGLGSGFIWDQNGHIVTNNHVVRNADQIKVTFHDGTSVEGEVIGSDKDSDLAVIKVDYPRNLLHPVCVADSTEVRVGQLVAAIGNPFGLEGTMTVGIVSALGRSLPIQPKTRDGSSYTIPDVIQTDAPINPGNSGGVLVDMDACLIGVTTAIESSSGVNAGVGFVVPSVIVQRIVPDLIKEGAYQHPWIGISGMTLASDIAEEMGLDRDQHGVLVVDVVPDSPAEKAGLIGSDQLAEIDGQEIRLGGDVIVEVDDEPIRDFEDLTAYLARNTSSGQDIELKVLREGKEISLNLTLGVRPTASNLQPQISQSEKGAWLGIYGISLNPDIAEAMELSSNQSGLLIQQVITDSPADRAGLRGSYKSVEINGQKILVGGDVILQMNGNQVGNMKDLQAEINRHKPGDDVSLSVLREGESITVDVRLTARP
ncbi:MAG TPA: PDZ domain-containing protein [Chloroflexi bacterium]|nr:PDZ domain-containing protein [Chloroflexota bacterium]